MNIKKILTAVMALCVISGTPVVYSADYSNTVYAESVVTWGSITLDNEHPSAIPTLTGIEASELSWYTSDKNVAEVDGNGKITAVGKGTCTISAYYPEKDTSYQINVTSDYEPVEQSVTEVQMDDIMFTNSETSKQIVFNAPADVAITYSSTDESIAVVDSSGLVTAKGMGKCQIFADIENTRYIFNVTSVYTGISSGAVNIGTLTLTSESSMQTITILGVSQDTAITWSSTDESIAVVSKSGVVSGIKKGKCIIYAETEEKKYAVNINVEFNIEDIMRTFEIEKTNVLMLSYPTMTSDVVYTSSDENIAVVDDKGNVTAKNIGETIIKAQSTGGTVWARVKVIEKSDDIKINLVGDANCDGSVDLADATSIIQHIGNEDRYGLSEQGRLNADCYNMGDGVTGMDAIAIQQLEAGIIKSLPVNPQS